MPRRILAALAVVGIAGALDAPARADLETAGRAIIQSMSEAVLASLHAGTDHATREAHFGEMYRRNFDNTGLAAWAAGRAFTVAPPGQRKQYHQLFEHYVVKSYVAQLQQYKGERLRIDKSETDGETKS